MYVCSYMFTSMRQFCLKKLLNIRVSMEDYSILIIFIKMMKCIVFQGKDHNIWVWESFYMIILRYVKDIFKS